MSRLCFIHFVVVSFLLQNMNFLGYINWGKAPSKMRNSEKSTFKWPKVSRLPTTLPRHRPDFRAGLRLSFRAPEVTVLKWGKTVKEAFSLSQNENLKIVLKSGLLLGNMASNLHTFVLIQIPSVTRTANTTHRRRQYCIFHQKGMRQHEGLARDMSFHWTGYGTDHTSTGGSAHRRRTCREAQLLCWSSSCSPRHGGSVAWNFVKPTLWCPSKRWSFSESLRVLWPTNLCRIGIKR